MLEMKGVRSGYGRLNVLFDIDFNIDAGEMVVVVGANGAGKSTLLKTILGAVPPSAGEIVFRGERVTSVPAHKRVAAGIALTPEGRQIFPNLSVRENLVCGAVGIGKKDLAGQLDRCFELFPIINERQAQRAGSLSGGEQQMLALSRALMSRPRLLLVDELSLGLAPVIVERLYVALRDLCDRGLAVVVVEQFEHYTDGTDRSLYIEKGSFINVAESSFTTAAVVTE
jgi:branched-chain amino acid transport system ATP-binding protein